MHDRASRLRTRRCASGAALDLVAKRVLVLMVKVKVKVRKVMGVAPRVFPR